MTHANTILSTLIPLYSLSLFYLIFYLFFPIPTRKLLNGLGRGSLWAYSDCYIINGFTQIFYFNDTFYKTCQVLFLPSLAFYHMSDE